MKVTIVGCGPAGVSAAIYVRRANIETTIIGTRDTALATAKKIENYYGFAEPISGMELFEAGLQQSKRLGCQVIIGEVISLFADDKFRVRTMDCEVYSDAIILAMGQQKKRLDIAGLAEFEGHGVSYCAICDAFFFRGKKVVVIGEGEYAIAEVKELAEVVGEVILLTNGFLPTADLVGISVITAKIKAIVGEDYVAGVVFVDGKNLAVDGVFVAVGVASCGDLARRLGVLVENNKIIVDEAGATNFPGVFAAGDCVNSLCQIATAVASGALAGISVAKYVRSIEVGNKNGTCKI
ncbi:MAG: FAD-dependent oxidoreductase [Oscillospiraceae bacterium]|nr:FAD-dependent oxidoreductase [Oscillospiraceae bacterium]